MSSSWPTTTIRTCVRADARAFRQTCLRVHVPPLLARSQAEAAAVQPGPGRRPLVLLRLGLGQGGALRLGRRASRVCLRQLGPRGHAACSQPLPPLLLRLVQRHQPRDGAGGRRATRGEQEAALGVAIDMPCATRVGRDGIVVHALSENCKGILFARDLHFLRRPRVQEVFEERPNPSEGRGRMDDKNLLARLREKQIPARHKPC
mmetsp:Transcript_107990/g.328227  ORF Transcript_107990/g.328227 Transcript_107990/m.328227 type:complete len:205 (+) Transcript_107990:242-856(+)